MMSAVRLRLAYLSVANMFALLRLLPASDRDKVVEILALRHQIVILERQLGKARPGSCPATGRSWPPCCTASPRTCCAGSGCWSGQAQCCAGPGI
jgi:hypothetical protein